MKSVGTVIKEARTRKKLSRETLEKETRIKGQFIKAIEEGNWGSLPEYPVVLGFVKRIASALGVDQKQLTAILRRDYKKVEAISSPKPDLRQKFAWSPRLTFFLGVSIIFLVVIGYLFIQYLQFISPPPITLDLAEESVVVETSLEVSGKTDADATVTVNNQPVLVRADGSFSTKIEIFERTEEVIVVARSRSGKETVVRRKIKVELDR